MRPFLGAQNKKDSIGWRNGISGIRELKNYLCISRCSWILMRIAQRIMRRGRMSVGVKVLHGRIIYGNVCCRSDISLNVFLCPMMLILF